MEPIVVPGWLLNNVGGFVGFVIFSGIFLKTQRGWLARKQEKKKQAKLLLRKKEEDAVRQAEAEHRQKQQRLDRLLPGPWRSLYELLRGCSKATRHCVLLTATSFERDVRNIPPICPAGFDCILSMSYYNVSGEGHCYDEFTALLGDHVKFPKKDVS